MTGRHNKAEKPPDEAIVDESFVNAARHALSLCSRMREDCVPTPSQTCANRQDPDIWSDSLSRCLRYDPDRMKMSCMATTQHFPCSTTRVVSTLEASGIFHLESSVRNHTRSESHHDKAMSDQIRERVGYTPDNMGASNAHRSVSSPHKLDTNGISRRSSRSQTLKHPRRVSRDRRDRGVGFLILHACGWW